MHAVDKSQEDSGEKPQKKKNPTVNKYSSKSIMGEVKKCTPAGNAC